MKTEKIELNLKFGALSKPLEEQLREQSFMINPNAERNWTKLYDDLIELYINGIILKSERDSALKRFVTELSKDVLYIVEE